MNLRRTIAGKQHYQLSEKFSNEQALADVGQPSVEKAIVIKHGQGRKRPRQLADGKRSKKRIALAEG